MADPVTLIRVIVLDGLDWAWCSANRDACPELWQIADDGCAAPLRACDPPLTPTAVCTLLTGRPTSQGWHGATHYVNSQHLVRTRPWFPELARYGYTVSLCNVPCTWPAFPMPTGGWMTAGFPLSPGAIADGRRPWHHPADLDVVGYPIDQIVQDNGPGGTEDLALARAYEGKLVAWFLDRAPRCSVELIWLRATDSAGHHHWGTEDYRQTVRHASALAGWLRRGAGTVVVVSDHGFDAIASPACASYRASSHGKAADAARLPGGHTELGILFAAGDRINARGVLAEQRLDHVAGGLFDLAQVPPAPGMVVGDPAWSSPYTDEDREAVRKRLAALGYL